MACVKNLFRLLGVCAQSSSRHRISARKWSCWSEMLELRLVLVLFAYCLITIIWLIILFVMPDLGWVNRSRVNDQSVKRRVDDILSSRQVQPDQQMEWLARSIQCIDLTTLAGM